MSKRLELMRFIIGKHHDSYAVHVADAVCGIEAIFIERLNRREQAVRTCPALISGPNPEPGSVEFMTRPTYGDGGMAAAVRLRSAGISTDGRARMRDLEP